MLAPVDFLIIWFHSVKYNRGESYSPCRLAIRCIISVISVYNTTTIQRCDLLTFTHLAKYRCCVQLASDDDDDDDMMMMIKINMIAATATTNNSF